ncbi:MAG TPA: hypothetical protein VMD78_01225 [Candidatus Baltobacteraceae bacterium]|nr:hypothetical protein [Candidatus Baltobacteraceae bacterium]
MTFKKIALSAAEIKKLRARAMNAIAPLKPADEISRYGAGTTRTNAGRKLPDYYFVYFLLVDLLHFRFRGRGEKVAWTIPVDYDGHGALIEHRKMGLGVFSTDELAAEGIVRAVARGVKAAAPFFDHLAAEAVHRSQLNVRNNSAWLFYRYQYLRDQFREKLASAEAREHEVIKIERKLPNGTEFSSYSWPGDEHRREAAWLATATIDAFFSWTEHVFVHLAILRTRVKTGEEVAELAAADWSDKFKCAVGLDDSNIKSLFDELLVVRRQIRNFMAHGAFGKDGEAFEFHSGAGAVPVNLTDPEGRNRFSMWPGPSFDASRVIQAAESFIGSLWAGDLAPAQIYIEEAGLPSILTYANDGTYGAAMESVEDMESFIDDLVHQMDDAHNMDW